jgi:hypothetical protein
MHYLNAISKIHLTKIKNEKNTLAPGYVRYRRALGGARELEIAKGFGGVAPRRFEML